MKRGKTKWLPLLAFRGILAIFAAFLSLNLWIIGDVAAQTTVDPMGNQRAPAEQGEFSFDTDPVGSVGSVLAATLATAGHSLQSAVLDFFEDGFASSMGALAFILAAIVAMLTIALGGHYKFGLWFLVGPWVFYWLLLPRIASGGVRWQVGGQAYDQQIVLSAAKGVTPQSAADKANGYLRPGNEVGKVSWFFVWWDDFTSDVVNMLVSLLRLEVKRVDLRFINRTQRFQTLMSANVTDRKLAAYIGTVMQGECGQFFGVMKDLYSANGRLNSSDEVRNEFLRSVVQAENIWGKVPAESPVMMEFLEAQLLYPISDPQTAKEEDKVFSLGKRPIGYIAKNAKPLSKEEGQVYLRQKQFFSCPEVWLMGVAALRDQAANLVTAVIAESTSPDLDEKSRAIFIKQAYTDLYDRVKNSCIKHYERLCKEGSFEARQKCEQEKKDWERKANDDQLREFADGVGKGWMNCLDENQQQLAFFNEIGVRMLFNHLQRSAPSYTVTTNELNVPKPWYARTDQTAHDIKEAAAGFEYEGKGIYLSAILAMPYIQGLGLYFLALAYPFACLLLVIPGRYHTFLQWMAIYFWLKTWDVGFAILKLVDGLLYNLLPQGPPITPSMARDPFETLKTVLEVDPAYSVNTYFNIMATLIGSIPLITGLLIKNGGGGIANALRQGFHNFSGRIGFAMLQYQVAARNMDLVEQIMKNERQAFLRARWESMKDPEVFIPLMGEKAMAGFKARFEALDKSGNLKGREQLLRSMERQLLTNGGLSQRLTSLWQTKLKGNLQYAVYNESAQVHNLRVAHDTIINWYSNHDFIYTHPYQRDIEHARWMTYAPLGGEKGLVTGAVKSVEKGIEGFLDVKGRMPVGGGRR